MEGPSITPLPYTGTDYYSKWAVSSDLSSDRGHAPDSGIPIDSEFVSSENGTPLTSASSEVPNYETAAGVPKDGTDIKTAAQTEERSLTDTFLGLPDADKVLDEARVMSSVSHSVDSSHTITYTVTISFAVPPSPTKDDDTISTQDTSQKSLKAKKLVDCPRPQGYYHFEYHLLPGHTEPTKADVVLFGVVAKLYIDHESQILKLWHENGKVWLIWSHNIELQVTKATILKALNHQIRVTIWDTKDKVSPRARFDKPKAFRLSQGREGDDSEVKQLILNQRKHFVDGQPRSSFVHHQEKDAEVSPGHVTPNNKSAKLPCTTESANYRVPSSASPSCKKPEKRYLAVPQGFKNMSEGSRLGKKSGGSDLQNVEAAFGKLRLNLKSVKGRKADGVSSKTIKKSLASSKDGKPVSAVSSQLKQKCLSFSMSMKPFLAGELSVTERLQETSEKLLDGYMTLATNAPLLSEVQKRELNPLVIRILSVTSLPNNPTSIHGLQEKCLPVYCKYKFYDQPFHCTRGQEHGTHVYFKDVNVILAGTINPSELRVYLNGPPLEIEVHDRDRKTKGCESTASLYGNEPEDEKLSNVGLVGYKHTLENPFTSKEELWNPYGIAKVRLTELVHGARYLNIRVPIHNCEERHQTDDRNGKIIGKTVSVDGFKDSPLPVGHYLDFESLLKVRVDIAVPLSLEASDGPYSRLIYIFDYENRKLLHTVIREITEINAKALNLDGIPHDQIHRILAKIDLTDGQKVDPKLDILTGIHVMDGSFHLFVLEGLKDEGIKKLWENLPSRSVEGEDGKVRIMYNSQMSFCGRIYKDLGVLLSHIHLHYSLSFIMKQPTLYIRDMVPYACFQALSRFDYICSATNLRNIIQNGLFPTAEMVSVLSREFGIPVSPADLLSECEEPFSNKLVKSQERNQSGLKRLLLRSPLDNYNEHYIKQKQEYSPRQNYIQHNIDKLYQMSKAVPKMSKQYVSITPVDSAMAHNYSSQSFSSTQHAHRILLQEMAKAWKENVLHANILKPTLRRDRWSWEQRHIDFGLYAKYHDRFTLSAPGAIHLAGERRQEEQKEAAQAEYSKWLQRIKVENLEMRFHRCLPETEMTSRGEQASDQQSRLKGLLKDPPVKPSLRCTDFGLQSIPVLALLPSAGVNVNYEGKVKNQVNPGFMPGDDFNHSLKLDRNRIPRHELEHKQFQRLEGKD
uniref:DUF4550 domain-containing protein n=1 Tax=Leptobrachium leishanense TaxID=445787 RepID=A0A8C5QS43_9ANUR